MSDTTQPITAVILGGVAVTVRLLNGSEDLVFVREMTPRLMPGYLDRIEDEAAMIEFVCDKPKGWADTLTWESIALLCAEIDRVNAPFFGPWLQRRVARLGVLNNAVPATPAPKP
jgi:hypothetical protein